MPAVDSAALQTTNVTDGVNGDATAGSTNYVVVTGTAASATGTGSFTVQTTDALETELAKVNEVISWEVLPANG